MDGFLDNLDKDPAEGTKDMKATKEEPKGVEIDSVGAQNEEDKKLEAVKDKPKEIDPEKKDDTVFKVTIDDCDKVDKKAPERSIHSITEMPEGGAQDRCGIKESRGVPLLSTLCVSVLVTYPSLEKDPRSDSNKRIDESPLLNFDSDYFKHSPSPRGILASEDSEGWVKVKREVEGPVEEGEETKEEKNEKVEDQPSATFTLAIVSRRSRHRAG